MVKSTICSTVLIELNSPLNLILILLFPETHPLLNKGKDKPTTKKGRPRLEHRKGK